jgi:hypothetical protein
MHVDVEIPSWLVIVIVVVAAFCYLFTLAYLKSKEER